MCIVRSFIKRFVCQVAANKLSLPKGILALDCNCNSKVGFEYLLGEESMRALGEAGARLVGPR
jgi:hypothetical protein